MTAVCVTRQQYVSHDSSMCHMTAVCITSQQKLLLGEFSGSSKSFVLWKAVTCVNFTYRKCILDVVFCSLFCMSEMKVWTTR